MNLLTLERVDPIWNAKITEFNRHFHGMYFGSYRLRATGPALLDVHPLALLLKVRIKDQELTFGFPRLPCAGLFAEFAAPWSLEELADETRLLVLSAIAQEFLPPPLNSAAVTHADFHVIWEPENEEQKKPQAYTFCLEGPGIASEGETFWLLEDADFNAARLAQILNLQEQEERWPPQLAITLPLVFASRCRLTIEEFEDLEAGDIFFLEEPASTGLIQELPEAIAAGL